MKCVRKLATLSIFMASMVLRSAAVVQSGNTESCSSTEYRQFDFWVGDWDLYDSGEMRSNARVRVERILGNCVLLEHYEDEKGTVGESFTTYDAARKVWHQTWVTNRGRLLTIEGVMQNGKIVLSGSYFVDNGRQVLVQGTWAAVPTGVSESAVTSEDAGKTWQPWFDISFKPHRGSTSQNNAEANVVANLDEEFQAAVKANDVATIDRILADDYILVTGTGKVFNKHEALDEARTRSTIYEHQEDTERVVRVWGDTAVVTAKLWIKGTRDGKPIDYTLWFSDTYKKTRSGWRYVFGQASIPLPQAASPGATAH